MDTDCNYSCDFCDFQFSSSDDVTWHRCGVQSSEESETDAMEVEEQPARRSLTHEPRDTQQANDLATNEMVEQISHHNSVLETQVEAVKKALRRETEDSALHKLETTAKISKLERKMEKLDRNVEDGTGHDAGHVGRIYNLSKALLEAWGKNPVDTDSMRSIFERMKEEFEGSSTFDDFWEKHNLQNSPADKPKAPKLADMTHSKASIRPGGVEYSEYDYTQALASYNERRGSGGGPPITPSRGQ